MTKTCTKCKQPKGSEQFYRDCHRPDGKHPWCRDCVGKAAKNWQIRNPDKVTARKLRWKAAHPGHHRAYLLKRDFGITLAQYNIKLESQGGVCAICSDPPGKRPLAVDHDHQTGKIRGLLCLTCNVGIGSLKDNSEILRRAITYLEGVAR